MDKLSAPFVYTGNKASRDYHPLETSADLDPLLERIGDARYVLLGEASHGTHEYYTWRSALTKRLIREKAFSFIAVEGDWPDCYRINRYVKGFHDAGKTAYDVLHSFDRWPTWMWANWEIESLVEWMRAHNDKLPEENRIGFYGMDVYSLWESLETVVDYLEKEDPETAVLVVRALQCFEPYGEEGQRYGMAASVNLSARCTEDVVRLLSAVRRKAALYNGDREAPLSAEVNALVISNAEKYYRAMVSFQDESWNIRDAHMVDTLLTLTRFHGAKTKAIIWEHNTHVGDARATDMQAEGLFNVGQLVREQLEKDGVVIVGLGGYEGSVIAGRRWGASMEKMSVPPARKGSVEEILHRESGQNKLLLLNRPALSEQFNQWLGHRAIGVVYHPESERGNYVPTLLPLRYDAFMYFDETQALHPLHLHTGRHQVPDTYPFGV